MTRIGRLDEVMLSVADLDRMRRFYADVVGFKEVFHHEGRMAGFDAGGAMLVLKAAKRPASGVALGLSCRGIEAILRRLASEGVRITEPLERGHWGARLVGFKDPEGNSVYLEEPVPKKAHRHRR